MRGVWIYNCTHTQCKREREILDLIGLSHKYSIDDENYAFKEVFECILCSD